jgi:AcrR family transcriptional regulator
LNTFEMNAFNTATRRAQPKTPKATETRERILDAAISLCIERGYAAATMREIADRAAVSLGNAYYYFPSKEHLVQGFYARCHRDHRAACASLLASTPVFRDRLRGALVAWQDQIEAFHSFAGVLFRTAADPESPLNPFSTESAGVRTDAIALFAEIVNGSRDPIPADLRPFLPVLLWAFHMGVVLFWIHDGSPGARRTRALIERGVDLICALLAVANVPGLGPARRAALRLLADVLPIASPTQEEQR